MTQSETKWPEQNFCFSKIGSSKFSQVVSKIFKNFFKLRKCCDFHDFTSDQSAYQKIYLVVYVTYHDVTRKKGIIFTKISKFHSNKFGKQLEISGIR